MNNRAIDLNLIFSTPIWTTIVPNYEEINDKMYNYTQHDLLITPEKYQMSQFQGKKFLDEYRKNRLKIMFKAENLNNQ